MSLEKILLIIKITFPFVDKNKLKEILADYGFVREGLSPEFLLEVSILHPDFLVKYAALAQYALETDRIFLQEIETGAYDFLFPDRADGKDIVGSITSILDSLTSAAGVGLGYYQTAKGGKTITDVAFQQEENKKQQQQDKSAKTTLLIVGGVVAVVLVVIMIFAFSKKK